LSEGGAEVQKKCNGCSRGRGKSKLHKKSPHQQSRRMPRGRKAYTMRMMRGFVTAVTLLAAVASACAADDPAGLWRTADGGAKVRIFHCGAGLCGKIVWLREPDDPETKKPKLDKFNKDTSRRARPVLGLEIISGMKPASAGRWEGSLYNPKDGNIYTGSITARDAGSLSLTGCVLRLFCRSETWKRTN
jgi:uncharacterized protein (DUF2147 family)